MKRFWICGVLAGLMISAGSSLQASEGLWTDNGQVICDAASTQDMPCLTTDGAGGAIAAWADYRSTTNNDVYVQRVNSLGAAQWAANGVPACTYSGNQSDVRILADGMGGAFLVWQDYRSGANYDLYAQRVNASGSVQWSTNGVSVKSGLTNPNYWLISQMVTDGAGGFIVAWPDYRNSSNYRIFAQRMDATGSYQWANNGKCLCDTTGSQVNPKLIADNAGGAIAVWAADRNNTGVYDVFAQRVNDQGDLQWLYSGATVCAYSGTQHDPVIVADGAGGAIVAWQDERNGNLDVYAQKINAAGVAQWTANGVAVCTATGDQDNLQITTNGNGGAILSWRDYRNATDRDVYAQMINGSGVPQWTANGVLLCSNTSNQQNPVIESDGNSGAVVVWRDMRTTGGDLYAQRVNASGTLLWGVSGSSLCDHTGSQYNAALFSTGGQGELLAWTDGVSGSPDIYVQRMARLRTTVSAIAPTSAQQGSTLTYTLTGTNFQDDRGSLIPKLRLAGQTDVSATNVVVTDNQHLTANFNLASAISGVWKVFVADSYGEESVDSGVTMTVLYSSPSATPTHTLTPTATPTATRTSTLTATLTQSPTSTPTPTRTHTSTPTVTGTFTATGTCTVTSTPTPTSTCSTTSTVTVSPSRSPTSTQSATATLTGTITVTSTITPTGTHTAVCSPTHTETASPLPTAVLSLTVTGTPLITVTPTSTSTRDVLSEVDLTGRFFLAFPNPANHRMTFVTHAVDHPAEMKVVVYNMVGERVAAFSGTLAAGRGQSVVWNCSEVTPGIYMAHLLLDGRDIGTCKIAVAR